MAKTSNTLYITSLFSLNLDSYHHNANVLYYYFSTTRVKSLNSGVQITVLTGWPLTIVLWAGERNDDLLCG